MTATSITAWRDTYHAAAEHIRREAPRAAIVITGASACIDSVYRIDTKRLDVLHVASTRDGLGPNMVRTALTRVANRRGGELLQHWANGPAWFAGQLGPSNGYQLGGTGPQASWSLAAVGATTACALRDRSAAQLNVIDPRTLLCQDDQLIPAASVQPRGEPTKLVHVVLEFSAGTVTAHGTVSRSSRIILRFGDEPIEQDDDFARLTPQLPARAGLVSGLNGPADGDTAGFEWLAALAARWRAADIRVHHELAEFPSIARLNHALDARLGNSIGLSLSELTMLTAGGTDPRLRARELAERAGATRAVIHADDWALCIHRGTEPDPTGTLLAGATLAAARARAGAPTDDLVPSDEATFTEDLPASGRLGDDWWSTAVPTPHLVNPTATIGLGDTFTAGVLLADSLDNPLVATTN